MDRQEQGTDIGTPQTPVAVAGVLAAGLQADDAEQHNEQGIVLARCGRFEDAAVALRTAIAIRPGYAKAHNNLGIVYAQQNRLADASAAFRAALAYRPDMAEAQNNLGNVLAMQEKLDEAIACFGRAIGLKRGYAEAHNNLGIALAEQGRLAEAVAAFGEVLRLKTGNSDSPAALESSAKAPYAVAAHERVPESVPTLNLAGVTRRMVADPHLAAMESLAEPGRDIPENSRIALHFALGKAYDDASAPERAFAHFLDGNILKRRSLGYDEAGVLAAMLHVRETFDAGLIGSLRGQGDTSAAPIFILGMPRSGCRLLEQMLAGHPDVFEAGERSDFSLLASAMPAPAAPTPHAIRKLGADYLGSVNAKALRRARVMGTMVGHFLHAGLVHVALPKARIIHMRRGAADTCFSCYTRLFRIGHEYSFDLGELGRYYRGYAAVMDHWRRLLPASVMIDVDYEALVADPRGQIARVLDHCGLPWSDSCLALRRGLLHGRSVGRWQRYAAYVAPLLSELRRPPFARMERVGVRSA